MKSAKMVKNSGAIAPVSSCGVRQSSDPEGDFKVVKKVSCSLLIGDYID